MNATVVILEPPEAAAFERGEEPAAAAPSGDGPPEPPNPPGGPGGPDEPEAQHLRALHRANEVRLARAGIKRQIARGELSVVDVIRSRAEVTQTMEIAELLTSQRRWGSTRARRFLAEVPMTESKTIGSMTERQRDTLACMLAALAPRSLRLGASPTDGLVEPDSGSST